MNIQCPKCGSLDTVGRGKNMYCNRCKKYSTIGSQSPNSFDQKNNRAQVSVMVDHRIRTLDDLIVVCEINTEEWEVERWICNKWEVGAMGEKELDNGKGKIRTKLQVEPLFQVKAWLVRKTNEVRDRHVLDKQIGDSRKYAPKYPKIHYPKLAAGLLYELDLPDIHFGKLTWRQESGQDYDIKIAKATVNTALDSLLGYARQFEVSRILFPLGNDFFNVDSMEENTTHGTPQQEDTRYEKTFTLGRELAVSMIERCLQIAPVDVMVVRGNHAEQREFFLGDSILSWFHAAKDVTVDNQAIKRKYYHFGNTLLGFTHGYYEKIEKLPSLMPLEAPDLWSKSKFREWHLGDKHHLKVMKPIYNLVDENMGVVIRILRSLSATDTWHFDQGFVGAIQAAQAFLWSPTNGMVAQFNAIGE